MTPKPTLQASLVSLASFVVIVAGMRAAKSLVVMILLSAFLAVILTPLLRWMTRMRVPTPIALLLIMAMVFGVGVGVAVLVGQSVNEFVDKMPVYQQSLRDHALEMEQWLESKGMPKLHRPARESVGGNANAPLGGSLESGALTMEPEFAVNLVQRLLTDIGALASSTLIIMVTIIFMLLEASRFPDKLSAALGPANATLAHLREIIDNVRRYMVIKTLTSILTGVLVAGFLIALNAPYALLWGLLAFLFNYVPNIGSIIAAIPAVTLELVDHGFVAASFVAAGYIAINCMVSYAVEPRFMGQGLGLSTLVVFLSLMFWGWALGPVGMLLSAPLTMIFKIILADYEDTQWIAVMLGPKAPEPET